MNSINYLLLHPSSLSLLPSLLAAMEDWNALAADCVVLSCCCQCLILQVLVLILLKFPYKLARKAREYVKKIRHRKREGKIVQKDTGLYKDESLKSHSGSFRIQLERFSLNKCSGCGCCIEEAEKVFNELSQKGEFAFGSFWGGENSESFPIPSIAKHELDYDVVRYKLIETFGSFSYISLCTILCLLFMIILHIYCKQKL